MAISRCLNSVDWRLFRLVMGHWGAYFIFFDARASSSLTARGLLVQPMNTRDLLTYDFPCQPYSCPLLYIQPSKPVQLRVLNLQHRRRASTAHGISPSTIWNTEVDYTIFLSLGPPDSFMSLFPAAPTLRTTRDANILVDWSDSMVRSWLSK
jgi:hypothetical protein